MNLSRDQEQFVKSAGQALVEWRGSMGAIAWLGLGVFLTVGTVASVVALRWIRLGGGRQHDPLESASPREEDPKTS